MALDLTPRAQLAVGAAVKQPNLVLEIAGVGTLYGYLIIKKDALIGDPGLEIGDPTIDDAAFYIGGLEEIPGQENAITMDGTTNSIRQMLQIDIGQGTSISTMSVALIDTGSITKLITPGMVITDLLYTRCKVYMGFSDVAWPEDYVVIFRGVVTDITADAGKIVLTLAHPDDRKQGSLYAKCQPTLEGDITAIQTTLTVDSIDNMLFPITGPDGSIDPSFEAGVIIDNEVIKYTGITGNVLTGLVRGDLFTTAAIHTDQTQMSTFYRLKGNCVDLALKLMASTGDQSNYLDGVPCSSFVDIDGTHIANAVYFQFIDMIATNNIEIGDFVTITGAINGANNVTLQPILDIIDTLTGQYMLIGGTAAFVLEDASTAVIGFRSQFDTLPDGLALINDEIDIDEHLRLQRLFLSEFDYDFYLKDTIDDTRTFLEMEIYLPVAAFSLPRKSRCSLGYHIGPLPNQDIKTFDQTNIKNNSQTKLVRTTNRQFYNEIVYSYDEDIFTTDFLSGTITISELSKAQIKGYDKPLMITSKGLRSLNGANSIAESQSNRRLTWYQYAAEVLSFGVLFSDGFNSEIGDIVWVDGTTLKMPDIKTGLKGMAGRYFFVMNKTLNFKTGDIQLDCIDTHYVNTGRYGLISPSSLVTSGLSPTEFIIGESFSAEYGTAERKKWTNINGATVRVRSADFTTTAETVLQDVSTNTIRVSPALPFTPATGMIMELVKYDDQVLGQANLVYVAMADAVFPDGKKQFVML